MKRLTIAAAALAVALATLHPVSAAVPGDGGGSLAYAFDAGPAADLQVLDAQGMAETRGRLLPWIVGIAGLDLALIGAFWGVYVPTYGAGYGCSFCTVPTVLR